MKKLFSKIFKSGVAGTVVVIALGLVLTFFPQTVADTIFYVLGTVCLVAACFYLYKCIKKESSLLNAFSALAYLALGLILVIFQSPIFSVLPLTAGICMLVFSLLKLYTAFSFRKQNRALFKKLLVPCVINAILGIVLILTRNLANDIITRIIGVILLYCACEGIVTKLLVRADSKFGGDDGSIVKKEIEAEFSEPDEMNK